MGVAPGVANPAVVIGLGNLVGLQTVRVLAARNVPVYGIADHAGQPFSRTRLCREVVFVDTASSALIDALEDVGRRLPARAVLYPCDDVTVLAVSAARGRLEPWYHLSLPDHDVLETLMDKARFHAWATVQGLPVPVGQVVADRDDVGSAAAMLRFPVVMKPDHRGERWFANTAEKAIRAETPAELLAAYERVRTWADGFTVHEWIEGGEDALFSCNAYFDRLGQPLVTFVARKVRQWPPRTGRSSLGVEVRNDEVLRTAIELFQKAGMVGLAYLEMKRDARTGEHIIVEPNVGRPTGRSANAEAGGVELVYTMYRDVLGLPLPDNRQQSYGSAKWIYLRWDLQSAYRDWRDGRLGVGSWLASLRGPKWYAIWSWRDPMPFVADVWQVIRKSARRSP